MRLHISTRKNFGFALVATVSMMVLLTLVAIAMLSLSTIEQRSSGGGSNDADRMARANARMALMIALGELQKAAGPDQRVTATSTLLGDSGNTYTSGTTAVDGKKHWVGVWDTSSYSPAAPDSKTFVRWLVSSPDSASVESLAEVGNDPTVSDPPDPADDVVIFEGLDDAATVKVPKVEVATTSGDKSYYAYWVEDEGVKADLNWYEVAKASTGSDDTERAQARRLSAMPARNYWLSDGAGGLGPFRDANDDGNTGDAIVNAATGTPSSSSFYDDIKKVTTVENISLVAGGTAAHREWLKGVRHTMSVNNRGVLSDTKQGGLRRDLTLAFEMDDAAEAANATLFNQQDGEFVGGTDKLASAHDYPAGAGLPRARHLFRERWDTGGPFSTFPDPNFSGEFVFKRTDSNDPTWSSNRDPSVARGPTWWALRDYHNLYKQLEKSGNNYRMKARAYYPNRESIGHAYSTTLDTISTWADHRDTDWRKPLQGRFGPSGDLGGPGADWVYLFRPAQASYAPVFLGTTCIFSVIATNYDPNDQTAEVAITMDPIYYLWNPYNREIEVDNVLVHFETGMSGSINIELTDTATGTVDTYQPDVWQLLYCNLKNYQARQANEHGTSYGFIINGSPTSGSFTLQPGEVVAASPSSTSGQSYLGYDPLNNTSGIFMPSIDLTNFASGSWANPESWNGINWTQRQVRAKVGIGATNINVGYYDALSGGGNAGRFFMSSSLGASNVTADDLKATSDIVGEQTQHTHMQLTGVGYEFIAPDERIFDVSLDLNTLTNFNNDTGEFIGGVKRQFGLFTYLMKPADWSGQVYPNQAPWHKAFKGRNPVEVFSRFNPMPMIVNKDAFKAATPNMVFNFISDQSANNLINNNGLNFSTSARNAFWGESYDSSGQTSVPMSNIPSSPLLSLVDFSDANLGTMAEEPFKAVGNSEHSAMISPIAPYGIVNTAGGAQTIGTGIDLSWLLNDALFDRYFLSGIVPEYTIGTGGYNATGSLSDTLHRFYGMDPIDPTQSVDPDTAQASPVMEPYTPADKTAEGIVAELLETALDDATNATPGYKKMAAYSLLKGGFNINCTDANTWAAFLRGTNNELGVKSYDGSIDSRSVGYLGFPQSNSPSPAAGTAAKQTWTGWSRLSLADEINNLAAELANQVKKRGPFMSVSDFVNHKVSGDTNGDGIINNNDITNLHRKGAIQAAIDTMTTNSSVVASAGGVATEYGWQNTVPNTTLAGNSATGVPGSVTQADVLRVLAPRLTARSDTFRIRGYGEVTEADGNIIAKATCEAVVQRLPEYVDSKTDPTNNEPWDEGATLNTMNQAFGRRFEIQSFRWLDDSEV